MVVDQPDHVKAIRHDEGIREVLMDAGTVMSGQVDAHHADVGFALQTL